MQIKAEEITIPEFAQQVKPKIERAAIKEFLHDSPAPIQNKNEAASLIKRFWHKLVSLTTEPDVEAKELAPTEVSVAPAVATPVVEDTKINHDSSNRNRNNNNRRNKSSSQQYRDQGQEPRPNRHSREPSRNVRPNIPPIGSSAEKVNLVKSDVALTSVLSEELTVSIEADVDTVTSFDADIKPISKKSNTRRGPNRRRPRNPNYKKPELDRESHDNGEETASAFTEKHTESTYEQPQAYHNQFVEQVQKIERSDSPAPVEFVAAPDNHEVREVTVNKFPVVVPVVVAEPAPVSTASAPKIIEIATPDSNTDA